LGACWSFLGAAGILVGIAAAEDTAAVDTAAVVRRPEATAGTWEQVSCT